MAHAHKSIAATISFLCGVLRQYGGDDDYVEVAEINAKVSLDERARQSLVLLIVCCKKVILT